MEEAPAVLALRRALTVLAHARMAFTDADAALDATAVAYKEQNAPIIEEALRRGKELAAAEDAARQLALVVYGVDASSKQPLPGVTIILSTKLNYDPVAALRWALAHNMAVIPPALDKKAFEAIVKATPITDLDITQSEVPGVRLSTDLSSYITLAGATTL